MQKGVDNLTTEQPGSENYFRFADNPGCNRSREVVLVSGL